MPDRVALFWAKVNKTDTCWLWTGATDREGYGRFKTDSGLTGAHRFSYLLVNEAIPEALDHLCRVRQCVRPDHLEAVSVAENTRRSNAYRRDQATGCGNGHRWSDGNEYVAPNGHRECRACNRRNVAAYVARKRVTS